MPTTVEKGFAVVINTEMGLLSLLVRYCGVIGRVGTYKYFVIEAGEMKTLFFCFRCTPHNSCCLPQVLGSRLTYGYHPDKGDDPWKVARTIGFEQSGQSPWFEYFWRDRYFANFGCWNSRFDPRANSYDPEYLHGH